MNWKTKEATNKTDKTENTIIGVFLLETLMNEYVRAPSKNKTMMH